MSSSVISKAPRTQAKVILDLGHSVGGDGIVSEPIRPTINGVPEELRQSLTAEDLCDEEDAALFNAVVRGKVAGKRSLPKSVLKG